MEKILLNENRAKSERQLSLLGEAKKAMNEELLPAFEELGIGKISTELLIDAVRGCELIEKAIIKKGSREAAKFSSPTIKKQLIGDITEFTVEAIKTLRNIPGIVFIEMVKSQNLLEFFEVSFEQADFVPGYEEIIRERNRVYLATEGSISVYNAVKDLAEAVSNLHKAMGPRGRNAISLGELGILLDKKAGEEGFVPSIGIDYDFLSI